MFFNVTHSGSSYKERVGVLKLPYGDIETPIFMPVGTLGMVKALTSQEVKELDYNLILNNTYHLYLRPGMDVITAAGGIRGLSGWKGNLLTDSGGFQVFSLSSMRKIQTDGVEFTSHVDGFKHFFTPEKVISIQQRIGSNIIMPLDVCTETNISIEDVRKSDEITLKWAEQSKTYWDRTNKKYSQFLFGIVQGNFFKETRERAAKSLVDLDFPGYSIGGLSVGEPKETMGEILDFTTNFLPLDKPRYLMGVGEPIDIINSVERGIDMFDSVYPTRVARNATVFTWNGRLLLRNLANKYDFSPIDKECTCWVCENLSRAYLRHLFHCGELVVFKLVTIHNLHFINELMKKIRKHIKENTFKEFQVDFLKRYNK